MNFQPIFDRVIAKEIKQENSTSSGIALSTSNPTSIRKAKILSIGNGCYEDGIFISMQVNIGDIILFEEHTSVSFEINGEEYLLIKQTDILAKQKEN